MIPSSVKGYGPIIDQLFVEGLRHLSVIPYSNGVQAYVEENGLSYVLRPAFSVDNGTTCLDTLDDVTRQWGAINVGLIPGPTNFVQTFNGADGVVEYFPQLSATTPANLATFPTLSTGPGDPGLGNGARAIVAAMRIGAGPGLYYLTSAISTNPDNFFVIPTFDDASRQWVYFNIAEQGGANILTNEIDFTAIQTVHILPPISYKLVLGNVITFDVTQKDGSVTIGPTAQAGTDAGASNIVASTVQTSLAALAVNASTAMLGTVASPNNQDMTINGLVFKITSGAVLGTATVFKGRLRATVSLSRF